MDNFVIYCTEDDSSLQNILVYTLNNTGFSAKGFSDGAELFAAVRESVPDLILLDIMLPGDDGITILKKLRQMPSTKKTPVIMLTAKSTEYDKVTGLDSGADDYITKPFGVMELVSRVKAVLRRTQRDEPDTYSWYGIEMDTKQHSVTVSGQSVELTRKEFELLKLLLINPGIVLTREILLEKVWGHDFAVETRTVDVHVQTLRGKLGLKAELIRTVRGLGYKLGGAY